MTTYLFVQILPHDLIISFHLLFHQKYSLYLGTDESDSSDSHRKRKTTKAKKKPRELTVHTPLERLQLIQAGVDISPHSRVQQSRNHHLDEMTILAGNANLQSSIKAAARSISDAYPGEQKFRKQLSDPTYTIIRTGSKRVLRQKKMPTPIAMYHVLENEDYSFNVHSKFDEYTSNRLRTGKSMPAGNTWPWVIRATWGTLPDESKSILYTPSHFVLTIYFLLSCHLNIVRPPIFSVTS